MELKETEMQLKNRYDSIDGTLTALETSLKLTANLLLVQKRLHHQLLTFKIECLPKTWNEFRINSLQTLSERHEMDIQNQATKVIDEKLQNIDGMQKIVGDLDLNIFKANDIKQINNEQ
jgi:hypothetical protein